MKLPLTLSPLLLGSASAADPSGIKTYLSGKIHTQLAGNFSTVGSVFFEDWKSSPFMLSNQDKRTDFVVISRLSTDVKAKNAALDGQINAGLNDLATFVDKLVTREKTHRATPEQAEQLQREAQNRATVITGRITQAAALLGVKLQ